MVCVLIVEDDPRFNKMLCSCLANAGYNPVGCLSAADAFSQMEKMSFDIIISDIMMKETDGFEFAEQVRLMYDKIPILFLTARDDIKSKERGYRIGIDDYMVKPIDFKELIMRIEAVLRRAGIANKRKLVIGDLTLDSDECAAYVNGKNIDLSVKEFNVLFKMLSYPKRTFTRTNLMNDIWGYDSESLPRTVDVCITKIRSKLENCNSVEIVTVHGLGYKAVITE